MAEYIDKWQAAANLMDAHLKDTAKAVDAIQYMDVADVRPVVRGKWIVKTDADGKTYGVCSECGYEQYAGHLKFCPNCGADMRGDDNGT